MKKIIVILCVIALNLPLGCPAAGVSAPSQSVRDNELRAAITSFILQRTAGLGWDVHLKRLTINGNSTLPEGKLDYEVVAPQQWEGWGGVSLTVNVRQNDRLLRNIPVRVEVEALTDMVVALRQIDLGTTITPKDIALQRREISSASNRSVRSIDEIAGKKARLTLRANQVVRTDQVEKIPVIKSGQMVTIVAENEVMKITVAGRARSAGAEGDIIQVQNLNSLKEIPARVLNATTVQVSF
jgi:flagella basal body P-ring formation protein FlgA